MRKKGILLALLVLALTMTVAVATAEECAHTGFREYDQATHEVVCTLRGQVGMDSGAQKASCDHPYAAWKYRITDTTHELICTLCGQSLAPSEAHFDICDQPGVCCLCEATGVTMAETRHVDREWHITDTTHEGVCTFCGRVIVEQEEHYEHCDNLGVCAICEATDVTFAFFAHYSNSGFHYEHDQTTHWQPCPSCGEIIWGPDEHRGYCNEPGVCIDCGATGVTIANIVHSGDASDWHITDTTHEQVCSGCGQIVTPSGAHYATCEHPGLCYVCGATDVTIEATNHPNAAWKYRYNDTTHEVFCTICGEIVIPAQEHIDYCDNPGVCHLCQATGVTFAVTGHVDREWHITDTTHEAVCTFCGQVVIENEEHYASCDNPNECSLCDATGVTIGYYTHPADSEWRITDTTHELFCPRCQQIVIPSEPHYTVEGDPAGICSACGAAYTAESVVLNSVTVSGSQTVGSTLTATIDATGATYYSFWVYDADNTLVQEAYMTASNTFSFTVTKPGGYVVLVAVTDGVTTATGNGDWFTVTGGQVAISGIVISGDQMVGGSVTATVSATGATYYSYWVYNGQGELVSEAYMTTSSSYSFTPAKPGIYNVFVTVSDGTNIAQENSGWFPVEGDPVVINSLTVTGDKKPGSPLTATVDAPGATGFSYWFYNADGTLLEEAYMVTTGSYTFTPETAGGYNIFVAVTDGVSSDQKNSGWFMVE